MPVVSTLEGIQPDSTEGALIPLHLPFLDTHTQCEQSHLHSSYRQAFSRNKQELHTRAPHFLMTITSPGPYTVVLETHL